ncbi:MAG: alpha/beta hydrolase [Bacteroidota bacterium]|nr:alpha/beta hydrolase [Bacteroidota bacterium]
MFYQSEGLQLYFEDHGNENAKTIIFIHGFPFDHSMWDEQVEVMSENYRVIVYDIRGHGISDGGDFQFTTHHLVEDLNNLITNLGLQQVYLCGLSMGGYLALQYAGKYPDNIKGIILADSKAEPDGNKNKDARYTDIKLVKEKGVKEFAIEFSKKVVHGEDANILSRLENMILLCSPQSITATLIALAARPDNTDVLMNLSVPTLIITGEYDKLIPLEAVELMLKQNINIQSQIIENVGHVSNLENPQKFNEIVISFLG